MGCSAPRCMVCKPADPEAKGHASNAFHDYLETLVPARPDASPARPTSTPSCSSGCRWPTTGTDAGRWAAPRPTGSAPTGRRCWRCRRCHRQVGWRKSMRLPRDHYVRLDSNDYSVHPVGDRPPDRGARRPGPGLGDSATARSSPTTTGSGPSTRRSPTPSTSAAAKRCGATGSTVLRPVADARRSRQTGLERLRHRPRPRRLDGGRCR